MALHNKQNVEGTLAMCDLHYNLAIVTIKSPIDLPALKLSDLPKFYPMQRLTKKLHRKNLVGNRGMKKRARTRLSSIQR